MGVPSGTKNLRSLIILGLDYNQFTGVVPQWLGSLRTLQKLSLSTNMFIRSIPSCLLVELLGTNQFSGHIPTILENLQTLATVTISTNNLLGWVRGEIFGIPTIAQIEFSFNNLDGEIPAEVANAKQLMYFDVSSNKLSGDIPSTLGNCESLEEIELGHNSFSGSILTSLGPLKFSTFSQQLNWVHLGNLQLLEQLDLSFIHLNGEDLCGGLLELHLSPCSVVPLRSTSHKVSVVLKIVIPVAVVVSVVVAISILLFLRRKQKTKSIHLPSYGSESPRVSYSDLVRATEGFSTSKLIGKGRYDSVYQGILFQDGHVVSIEVFSLETRGALRGFIAECKALRNVRHRNLVQLFTACSCVDSNGNDFKALVYEFMPQGDLHNLLYSTGDNEDSSYLNYISLAQ
ncbi:hypothetical protein EJB05_29165, partial [Eragrostis curvula]